MPLLKTVAYIIHLAHSFERANNVELIQAVCPLQSFVKPAVNGNSLSNSEVNEVYKSFLYAPQYPFLLRRTEIGTFLSHRSCWKSLLDDGIDAALILEDDLTLHSNFTEAIDSALEHINDLGFINFPVRPVRHHPRNRSAKFLCVSRPPFQLYEPPVVPLGVVAYFVSRKAAKRLLDTTRLFDRPVDCFLQLRSTTKQPVFVIDPSCVTHDSVEAETSTIHSNDKRMPWLQRETKRFLYRRKVKQLSRQYWNEIVLLGKHTNQRGK